MLLNYRKDIDGLRAIAVLLVVLFHAGFAIPGGFIGVDIFFVISGFLIASLIQKQILRDKFTFKGFYLHRMRRILPALVAVMLLTLLVSWFVLMPIEFNKFIRSGFFALLSLSNMFFWFRTGGYFDGATEQMPLLHTWSLSVEEQFYIGMPIFLIILFKFFYNTKWFNYILTFTLVFSFAVSQFLAIKYASLAYYGLPARFFELFIGVWLALNYEKLPALTNKYFNNALAVVGLLLIFIPAFTISKESVFPGHNALLVCLGSAILIYLGKCESKTLITNVLSTKVFVFIGLISYSLYLWHWPVLSLLKVLAFDLNTYEMSLLVLALIFISYLSWKFIEQPFRNKYKFNFTVTFIILFILPLSVFYGFKRVSFENTKFDEFRLIDNSLVQTYNTKSHERKDLCQASLPKHISLDNKKLCKIGDLDQKTFQILFYGDSHGQSISGFIETLLRDANLQAYPVFNGGLLYLKENDYEILDKTTKKMPLKQIKFYTNYINQEISSNKYDYVIIASFYAPFFNRFSYDDIERRFINTVKQIVDSGARPVIVKDVPMVGNSARVAMYNKIFGINKNTKVTKKEAIKQQNKEEKIFAKVKEKFPQTIFIDPKKVMCDDENCITTEKGISIYRDSNHLSDAGSKYLGAKYLEKYGNPFANLEK